MYKDSAYAAGLGIKYLKHPTENKNIAMKRIFFEAIKYLNEVGYITSSAMATVLNCTRLSSQKILKAMWKAQLLKCIQVVTSTNEDRVFTLWMSSVAYLPKDPNLACRLAALGEFYSRAQKNLPGLGWNIIRNKDKKSVLVEMTYLSAGKEEKSKLTLDAPRRGEKPLSGADIYIFPTVEEAKLLTPVGKRYTTDLILKNKNIKFGNIISDPL